MASTNCKQAVISNDYKGFGLPNRGSDEEVAQLLGADCVRRVSDNLAFAYFYDPDPEDEGRGDPFGIMQKCYGLLSEEELAASGVLQLREGPFTNLRGSGVLLGFVDTGIDFVDTDFRNTDGSTRLVGLWDQTLTAQENPVAESRNEAEQTGAIYNVEGRTTSDFTFTAENFPRKKSTLPCNRKVLTTYFLPGTKTVTEALLYGQLRAAKNVSGASQCAVPEYRGKATGVSHRHRRNKRKPTTTPTAA